MKLIIYIKYNNYSLKHLKKYNNYSLKHLKMSFKQFLILISKITN